MTEQENNVVGEVPCDICGGSGIVAETTCEPKCCGRTNEYGDCCNNPIPDWRQEPAQCHKCRATGLIQPPVISSVCDNCSEYELGSNPDTYCNICGRMVEI